MFFSKIFIFDVQLCSEYTSGTVAKNCILNLWYASAGIEFGNSYMKLVKCYELTQKNKKENFMVPFDGWGSTASGLQPLPGGSLLFTIQFPERNMFHLFPGIALQKFS